MQTEENKDLHPMHRLGIVGYGEVGRIFAVGLRALGVGDLVVWDSKFIDPARSTEPLAHAQAAGLNAAGSVAALCAGRQLIVSAFTASNTLAVAEAVAPLMTSAIADKQQWVADLARAGVFADLPKDARWQDYADRVLGSLSVVPAKS